MSDKFRQTVIQAIPGIPADCPASISQVLDAIKTNLETGIGVRTKTSATINYDKWVRVRDLTDSDFWRSVGYPMDEETSSGTDKTPPGEPTSFTVTQGVWTNYLSWTNPTDDDFAYVEVWGGQIDDVESASLLSIVSYPSTSWAHPLYTEFQQDWFYWIRAVDFYGNASDFVGEGSGSGGVEAPGKNTVGQMIDAVMDILNGYRTAYAAYSAVTAYFYGDRVIYTGPDGIDRTYKCVVSGGGSVTGQAPLLPDGTLNISYWTRSGILVEGDVDGVATVGIDGNAVIDGTLLARSIKTDELIVGDNISIANGAITIDSLGSDVSTLISDAQDTADAAAADAATAIASAATAQATADGKIDSFYQTTPPTTGMAVGDLWFDSNDGYKQYRYNGSSWVSVQDTLIGDAITAASGAQATADGKVTTFYAAATSIPTSEAIGDLWYNKTTYKLYRAAIAGANEIKAGEWVLVSDITGSNTAKDIIHMPDTPTGAGFFNTGTYMGFYDSTKTPAWRNYFDNTGKFFFTGDGNNYFQWDGSTLTLSTDDHIEILEGGDFVLHSLSSNPAKLVFRNDYLSGTGDFEWTMLNLYSNGNLYLYNNNSSFGSNANFNIGASSSGISRIAGFSAYTENNITLDSNGHVTLVGDDYVEIDSLYVKPGNSGVDIGSSTYPFADLFLSGNIDLGTSGFIIGSSHVYVEAAGDTFTFAANVFHAAGEGVSLGYSGGEFSAVYATAYYDDGGGYNDGWTNPETGKFEEVDDLSVIRNVKHTGKVKENGFLEMDMASVHPAIYGRHDRDGEIKDKEGKIVSSWKKGDVILDKNGFPVQNMGIKLGITFGALKQLDEIVSSLLTRIEQLEKKEIQKKND